MCRGQLEPINKMKLIEQILSLLALSYRDGLEITSLTLHKFALSYYPANDYPTSIFNPYAELRVDITWIQK